MHPFNYFLKCNFSYYLHSLQILLIITKCRSAWNKWSMTTSGNSNSESEIKVYVGYSAVRYSLPNPLTKNTCWESCCNPDLPSMPLGRKSYQPCTRMTPLASGKGKEPWSHNSLAGGLHRATITILSCPTSPPGRGLSPSGQGSPVKSLYANTPVFPPTLQHLYSPKQDFLSSQRAAASFTLSCPTGDFWLSVSFTFA